MTVQTGHSSRPDSPSRNRWAGGLLIAAGVIGVVTGAVPLAINAARAFFHESTSIRIDLAAHGVEAMGLSVEWALLSCTMGVLLGILLLWAGRAWLRGRATAPLLSWIYVLAGLMVNLVDMLIFLFLARPGAMRSRMLFLDGLATLLPVVVAAWLIARRRTAPPPGPRASGL